MTSLAVQWLKPCASTTGGQGSISVGDLRSCVFYGMATFFLFLIKINAINELICKTETDSQTWKTNL